MKKVAYIASECVPFIKTGGLADVVGTLPKIFDKNEYDVRVIMPNYLCIPNKYREKMQYITHFIWTSVTRMIMLALCIWSMRVSRYIS